MHRAGELVAIRIPSVQEEAVRDLCRARADMVVDRTRYLGQRKNLFDLRRVAVVHNLHVIARQPPPAEQAA